MANFLNDSLIVFLIAGDTRKVAIVDGPDVSKIIANVTRQRFCVQNFANVMDVKILRIHLSVKRYN